MSMVSVASRGLMISYSIHRATVSPLRLSRQPTHFACTQFVFNFMCFVAAVFK